MRLITWNVGMALRRKLPAIDALEPDVAVLQEVNTKDVKVAEQSLWIGNLPQKGLGVAAFNGFKIERDPLWDPRIEFVIPINVSGTLDFLLLAVWIMHNRAVKRIEERPNRWQLLQALEVYEPLIRSKPTIVAGDFNNAVVWDTRGKASNHAVAVQKLHDLGLESAYHASRQVAQGQEPEPTLYWRWLRSSGYHIDYVWLPKVWLPALTRVDIGEYAAWPGSHLSDHVPLAVEIDADVVRRLTEGGR